VDRDLRVAMTLEQCWHRVPGGTAVAAIEMAKALSEAGIDVVGVSARHSGPPPEPWSPPVATKGLALPRPALYESWHRLRIPKVQRATGRVDVIHATTASMPPKSAPLVATIHDLAWTVYPEHFTKRGLRFFERGLELARSDADVVLCSSLATMRDCEIIGIDRKRLRHVPLGVTARRANEDEIAAARARNRLENDYVMWTGTVEPRKNLRGLVKAFASLESIDLDLVLVGPKGWNEDLDDVVAPMKERVHPLGFVPAADLGPLYAGARVFCYPSFLEGFGFPVLEAMAQGTPVVTSMGTSTEELGRDAAVLVDPKDPGAIGAGLQEVLDDEALSRKLSEAGPQRASEYTWARTAELILNAYREIA
jgi:glycosyltransferase involved in cell wall biosynthesis